MVCTGGVGRNTFACVRRGFLDNRQADQASAEIGGTHTRGGVSVWGVSGRRTERPYVLRSVARPSTPLAERSGWGVRSIRNDRGRSVGETEGSRGIPLTSVCYWRVGVNRVGASVRCCRQRNGCSATAFGPSWCRCRLYPERTWLTSIRVGVT